METATKKIQKQMTISDILGMFPSKSERLAQEITNAGLHCVGCQAATWETLEAGMLGHGKNEEEINRLVNRLNALLLEKSDPNTVSLTEEAANKFMEFAKLEGKVGAALRFGEEMAGCSGFEYVLDFSMAPTPDDAIFTSHGVDIHVHKKDLPRLIGCKIDYLTGIRDSGFKVIENPNTRSCCGCGSSHGY